MMDTSNNPDDLFFRLSAQAELNVREMLWKILGHTDPSEPFMAEVREVAPDGSATVELITDGQIVTIPAEVMRSSISTVVPGMCLEGRVRRTEEVVKWDHIVERGQLRDDPGVLEYLEVPPDEPESD
jgi:hypothetical protein